MSVKKYSHTFSELADFLKSVVHLKADLDFLLKYGLERLDFGMHQWKDADRKPSFNVATPPYVYREKNLYIDAANNLWYKTMWRFSPQLNEIYYNMLLERVKEYETNQNFRFNKGIVYANLGVAQSAQMKIDDGFANILKALIEDSGYSASTPQHAVFRGGLFRQFERLFVKNRLQKAISELGMNATSPVGPFTQSFLDSLNNDQRTFFDYTFALIMHNLEIWKEKENGFTANRLLAYVQDFCLFNEDLLKSKISQTVLSTRSYWTLKNLIPQKFSRISLKGCAANDMTELDRELPQNLSRQRQPAKCLRILVMLRNYSSHNVSGGTSRNCFFARFEEIFAELVRALCYIIQLP